MCPPAPEDFGVILPYFLPAVSSVPYFQVFVDLRKDFLPFLLWLSLIFHSVCTYPNHLSSELFVVRSRPLFYII
jgi:hypothetical protein